MPTGLAIGGATIGSALIGSSAARAASSQQTAMEEQALEAQNAARQQLNPWINTGQGANYTLASLYGLPGGSSPGTQNFSAFTNSPDFLFAQQQGNQAVQNYLNSTGQGMGGAGMTAIANYNQGLASQQFSNYFNRMMGISNQGLGAAEAGVQGANAAAGTMGNIGQSMASGTIGSANALTGGMNNLALYSMLGRGGSGGFGFNPSSYGNPFGGTNFSQMFGGFGGNWNSGSGYANYNAGVGTGY